MFFIHDSIQRGAIGFLSIILALGMIAGGDVQSAETYKFFCGQASRRFGTNHGTDCWGWVAPDGTEYALVGRFGAIIIVNASTMSIAGQIGMPNDECYGANWSDIKTYRHYAYFVSECSGYNQGLTVVDLQYLPDPGIHITLRIGHSRA